MGIIRENQKVKLIFKLTDNSEKEIDCLVKEAYTDRISLKFPEDMMEYAEYLGEGEELTVKIFTPAGVKILDTIILDSPLEPEFVIEYTETSTDIQRREYVRVQMEMKIVLERENKKPIVTNTIDISGGGLKFYCEESFYPDEPVNITLYMPESRAIQAKGIIIENNYIPQNERILTFTNIEERERDRIIKLCFEAQVAKY